MTDKDGEQELLSIIAELSAMLAELTNQVAELQEALNTKKHRKDSHNSSQPPSGTVTASRRLRACAVSAGRSPEARVDKKATEW